MSLQARREGKCDGVVTYCLDKRPQSRTFALARDLFHQYTEVRGATGQRVPLWGRFETSVVNSKSYTNPFTDVELVATFTRPDKSRVSFWGFHDGDGHGGQTGNVWKLRFMPDQAGTWSYECSFSDGAPGESGTFDCVGDGARPGPLRVDPANPRCWVFADGSHFFPRAYTAPELFVAGNRTHRTHWIDYFFGTKAQVQSLQREPAQLRRGRGGTQLAGDSLQGSRSGQGGPIRDAFPATACFPFSIRDRVRSSTGDRTWTGCVRASDAGRTWTRSSASWRHARSCGSITGE